MLDLTLEENEISGPEHEKGPEERKEICNERALYKETGKRAC